MANEKFKAYFQFIGGQNSSAAPDNLADSEILLGENVDVVLRGAIKTREGTGDVTWNCLSVETTGTVDRTAEFSTAAGTLIQLCLINGKLYRRDSTTPLLSSAGAHMDYTVYNNKMYILIKDSYYVYDGTTLSEVTNAQPDSQLATIKKCKFIEVRADRIFCAGNPDSPNSLYYSQVGDPTYFKTGQFVMQAASGDGDIITGLREFNEALLVFKRKGVWAWTGYVVTSDVTFSRLNVHTGTSAYRTIQNVGNYLLYLGEDGVYAMKGTYNYQIVTEKVSGSIDNYFSKLYFPSTPYLSKAVSVVYKGKYLLCYSKESTTTNDTLVACHFDAGSADKLFPWTVYTGLNFVDALKSADGNYYFSKGTAVGFFKFADEYYSDSGANIPYKVRTKDYDCGSPVHIKKLKRLWLALRQYETYETTFNTTIYVDYRHTDYLDNTAAESLVYDKGSWGDDKWGWIDTITRAFKLNMKGLRVGVEVTGTLTATAPETILLYGVAFMYKIKKPYKD